MKKILTLFFTIAFMAIAVNATVTINVRTSTGDAPYLYVWDGGGNQLNGAWPGTLMDAEQTYTTTSDGLVWFTQTFEEDAINIIFNDGGIDGEEPFVQTTNIMGVTETNFYTFDPEEGGYEDVTSTYITPTGFDINTLPNTVVYVDGKEFAYFIAPKSWTKCNVWVWSNTTGTNFTTSGTWPGDPINYVGNTSDGSPVYQWIGPDINEADRTEFIIFNNGSTQTADLNYVAGGVYNLSGKLLYTVPNPNGGIELLEPVITDNYIEFVGVNNTGNYKFTLNTYEWGKGNGPQFQLIIEPIDPSKPAFFSQGDLSDPNYWEPMFMRVTEQMAGQAMTVQNNIKRLYLGDVQLLPNQFIDYNNLHIVGFDLKKDYTLPEGCLLNAGQHMDEMDVKCLGTMTLSPNSLPADKAFYVTVYSQPVYDMWDNYKQTYNCQYILNMEGSAPAITAVKITANVDNEFFTEQLPASGFEDVMIESPINNFYLNRFEVDVNIDVEDIFMDYAIYKEGESNDGWLSIHATKTEDGKWVADNINLNILQGLEAGQTYILSFDFISSYEDEVGDRLRYDNGGRLYHVRFIPGAGTAIHGDVNGDGNVTAADVTALYDFMLMGDTSNLVNGDQTGDGEITSADVTTVYNVILGIE